jgi:hypothetical protein
MPGPSDNLKQLLCDLNLCTDADLRRCQTDVRRLCGDLPDFDSVWLDVLVRRQHLTAWQAEVLQSDQPSSLQVDRFVLTEPLGQKTWRATTGSTGASVVIRRLELTDSSVARSHVRQQVEAWNQAAASNPPPDSLWLPREVVVRDDEVFLAGPFVAGYSADELILRGGRLPQSAVQSIGQDLWRAVAWLESFGTYHGRLSLRNLRIRSDGTAVLVAACASVWEKPQVSFGDNLTLQDVDSMAPELVSTGRTVGAASELYSAGLLLWQLLAARSPFLTTDPINRILKAQQEDVSDVRDVVPDCPDAMAECIQKLSRRNSSLRPASAQEAQQDWNRATTKSRSAVRAIIRSMPERTIRRPAAATSPRKIVARGVAVVGLVLCFVTFGWQRGLLPVPLSIDDPSAPADVTTVDDSTAADVVETSSGDQEPERSPLGYRIMPPPDAAGVVVLQSGETYEASDLNFEGVLHVEPSDADAVRVIVPAGSAWKLNARQVSLSGLVVTEQAGSSASTESPALIQAECDVLSAQQVTMHSTSAMTAVRWSSATEHTGVIRFTDVAVTGTGYALHVVSPAQRCEFYNVLLLSEAGGLRVDTEGDRSLPPLYLNRITQARGRSTVDVFCATAATRPQHLLLETGESVVAPTVALVRWAGSERWTPQHAMVRFVLPERGNPTIVPPNLDPVVVLDRSLQQLVALPDSQLVLESLLLADAEFRGAGTADVDGTETDFRAFEVLDYAGPKLNTEMPGCDVSRLISTRFEKQADADSAVSSTGR